MYKAIQIQSEVVEMGIQAEWGITFMEGPEVEYLIGGGFYTKEEAEQEVERLIMEGESLYDHCYDQVV